MLFMMLIIVDVDKAVVDVVDHNDQKLRLDVITLIIATLSPMQHSGERLVLAIQRNLF
jgi:hypothetical protein